MRKLFILPEADSPYADELLCARERVGADAPVMELAELDVARLKELGSEVVISTGLPEQWYYVLRGMSIVAVTLGERDRYYDLADIVIDCLRDDPKRYFVSTELSLCQNGDFGFEGIVNLITKLEWDSNFFGFNVAFLSCMHLTDNIYRRIERFIREQDIRLVEYLCNCHDARSVHVAEARGFQFADIRLTFQRPIRECCGAALPQGVTLEKATEADIPDLRRMAGGLYEDSRYVFDTHFDPARIDEFYRGWVEKGVRGQYDDECWCLYDGAKAFAFCTVRYGKQGKAHIGLVGLDPDRQGGGFGKLLLQSVFDMLFERGVRAVSVVTQGRNYAAQNLYQSVGMRTKATQLWYHKWI